MVCVSATDGLVLERNVAVIVQGVLDYRTGEMLQLQTVESAEADWNHLALNIQLLRTSQERLSFVVLLHQRPASHSAVVN